MSDGQDNRIITPGLSVDSDWKAEARKEKERLAAESAKSEARPAPGVAGGPAGAAAQAAAAGGTDRRGQLPSADFATLVSQMVTQAMLSMGMIPDPQTGRRVAMLDLARYHIDMLGVIEAKTKGNLDADEAKLIAGALYELRMQYVQLSQQAIAEQTGAAESHATR